MTTKARLAVGGAVFVVGLWLFIFPFVGPSMGLRLYSPTASAATSSMSGMTGSGSSTSGMKSTKSMKKSSSSMSSMSSSSSMSSMSGSGSTSSMSGMGSSSSSSSGIVINHATVAASLIPGVVIAMLGIFLLAGAFDYRRQQAPLMP